MINNKMHNLNDTNTEAPASTEFASGEAAALAAAEKFRELYGIIRRLRAPDGCPWDKEQTPLSIRGNLIEECYECVEAIDEGKPDHIKEELGDVFLLAVMLSYMHEQEGAFSLADALQGINEKLVRRHPHVFGDARVKDSDEVLVNWAKIKVEQEGRAAKDSILDEVSRALPPLDRAYKLQKKAAKAGFDWKSADGIFDKISEETDEVKAEIAKLPSNGNPAANGASAANGNPTTTPTTNPELEGELGDLLFSVINLCRFYKIEPSLALARTNAKWTDRFKYVEKKMKSNGLAMNADNFATMDALWEEAKRQA